jgi:hypothetical protein
MPLAAGSGETAGAMGSHGFHAKNRWIVFVAAAAMAAGHNWSSYAIGCEHVKAVHRLCHGSTTTGENLGTQGLTWHNSLDVPVFGGPHLADLRQAAEFIVHVFLNGLGILQSS